MRLAALNDELLDGQLMSHIARPRHLTAGTIAGSGTVSNVAREAGSACITERRVIGKTGLGKMRIRFMRFGDRVRMRAKFTDGRAVRCHRSVRRCGN